MVLARRQVLKKHYEYSQRAGIFVAPEPEEMETPEPAASITFSITSTATTRRFTNSYSSQIEATLSLSVDYLTDDITNVTITDPRGRVWSVGTVNRARWFWIPVGRPVGISNHFNRVGTTSLFNNSSLAGTWTLTVTTSTGEYPATFTVNPRTITIPGTAVPPEPTRETLTYNAEQGTSFTVSPTVVDGIPQFAGADLDSVNSQDYLVCETPGVHLDMQYPVTNVSTLTGLGAIAGANATLLRPGSNDLVGRVGISITGDANLDETINNAVLGVPFRATFQTLKPVYSPSDSIRGVDIGIDVHRKLIQDVWLDVYATIGLKVGPDQFRLTTIEERVLGETYLDTPPPLDTAGQFFLTAAQWENDAQVWVVQDVPLPATVLTVSFNIDLTDPRREGAGAVLVSSPVVSAPGAS